jgi:hypothetical protein
VFASVIVKNMFLCKIWSGFFAAYLFSSERVFQPKPQLTKRAADGGESAVSQSESNASAVFGFTSISDTLPPSAANASRWGAEPKSKTKYVFDSQSWFCVWLINSKLFFSGGTFQSKVFGQYFFGKQVFKFSAFSLAAFSSLA